VGVLALPPREYLTKKAEREAKEERQSAKNVVVWPWYIQSLPPPMRHKLKQPSRFWRFKRYQREVAVSGGGEGDAEIYSRVRRQARNRLPSLNSKLPFYDTFNT
jgi:hypothetical protein